MSSDIVERLRLLWTEPIDDVALYETINATAAEIVRLRTERDASRAEVERLRDEMSTMHRTVVHDCCVQVQSERALADQLASHLEWALRCVGSLPTEMRMTFDNRMAEVLAAHKEARRER